MTMAAKKKDERTEPETVKVVMLTATYDAGRDEVVEVSPEQAAALIENGHARAK